MRVPRRTARLRLTVLYSAAFLVCGAAVLAVVTYLVFGRANISQPGNTATAEFSGRVPAAAVHRAGANDIIPVPVPAYDVQQSGRYNIVNIRVPESRPGLTAAQRAKLLSEAQVRVSYDERQILIIAAAALAVIAVAAAVIGWLIAGRVLRPLRTITAAARRISASSLHERLALHGPDDELRELGDTLDGLFARLEASFDAQRRFAANASHELRTPLTRERTLLQVTLADPAATTGTWEAVGRELLASNAEQEHLIEAMLTLASSEAGTGEREPLDLAAITSAAMAAARPAIGRHGLHAQTAIQPAALDGDPFLIQQLAANLIDNAVRHNIAGGDVQVGTATSDAGAVLSVTNSGQVIPAAEVDRLFQPFQRLGSRPARRDGGHGLGLSIVKAIATAHAATITARPRPGGGLTIDVTFPPPSTPPARPAVTRGEAPVPAAVRPDGDGVDRHHRTVFPVEADAGERRTRDPAERPRACDVKPVGDGGRDPDRCRARHAERLVMAVPAQHEPHVGAGDRVAQPSGVTQRHPGHRLDRRRDRRVVQRDDRSVRSVRGELGPQVAERLIVQGTAVLAGDRGVERDDAQAIAPVRLVDRGPGAVEGAVTAIVAQQAATELVPVVVVARQVDDARP